jgi:signal transduction histidine kinase
METTNANHLIIANNQILVQNKLLEKYCEKLTVAKKKIIVHRKEKRSRESELAIANMQLIFENHEKGKRACELAIANAKLIFENNEKEKRADELVVINNKLSEAELLQKQHIAALEEMTFIISHRVRNQVANILGIAYLLESCDQHSDQEFKKLVQSIIASAASLNTFTQELSTFIHNKRFHHDH